MAEWPDRIKKVFITKSKSRSGAYSMKICDLGVWRTVTVDDYIPLSRRSGKPAFAKNKNQNEMWVILLEKAYSKLYRGYANIEGGIMTETMHDLTGAPTASYTIKSTDNNVLWNHLIEGE